MKTDIFIEKGMFFALKLVKIWIFSPISIILAISPFYPVIKIGVVHQSLVQI